MKKECKYRNRKLKKKIKICIIIVLIILMLSFTNNRLFNKKDNSQITNEEQIAVFPSDVYGVKVYNELIDINTKARSGQKRIIKYIVIHETDNYEKGVGAFNHAKYLKDNNTSSTSWHYTVDDKEIYHHIPDDERANHAGDNYGNEYGIGIELCVNVDGNFEKTFENASKLVAYLLKSYNLDIDAIKTHHDFSGKDCPHSILKNNWLKEFKMMVKYYLDI